MLPDFQFNTSIYYCFFIIYSSKAIKNRLNFEIEIKLFTKKECVYYIRLVCIVFLFVLFFMFVASFLMLYF